MVQIYWIFADSGDFFEDSGDVCKIRRLSTPTEPTEHHPNPKPTRPSDAGGRFRVPPPSTRRRRIGSGLGPKPTRPDPWTALPFTLSPFSFSSSPSPQTRATKLPSGSSAPLVFGSSHRLLHLCHHRLYTSTHRFLVRPLKSIDSFFGPTIYRF